MEIVRLSKNGYCRAMSDNESLYARVKKRMFQAMKAGETVEKEILRTAMGEVTSTGEEATDPRVQTVLRKLVKSNLETLAATTDEQAAQTLRREVDLLQTFLPTALTVQQVVDALAPVRQAIASAASAGPAMGVAMKTLKAAGAEVDGQTVQAAVAQLRAETPSGNP